MAHPWNPGDAVQVKVGTSWVNATVDEALGNGRYSFTVTDNPLPTLGDCGLSHRILPSTTPVESKGVARHIASDWDNPRIRDPI